MIRRGLIGMLASFGSPVSARLSCPGLCCVCGTAGTEISFATESNWHLTSLCGAEEEGGGECVVTSTLLVSVVSDLEGMQHIFPTSTKAPSLDPTPRLLILAEWAGVWSFGSTKAFCSLAFIKARAGPIATQVGARSMVST
jgi:hypothetical protein